VTAAAIALVVLFAVALGWRLLYLGRLAATPLGGSLTEDARIYWEWSSFLLRHGPVGRNPFFMGPLYPYVLTGLRMVLGDSIPRVLVVQAVWGAAATVLLADAARRLSRPAIGIALGVLVGFYPMAVFFDGLVLMESLLFFLGSLALWLVVRERAGWRPLSAAALGALIGLLAEGRAISLGLLLPAVPLVMGAWRGAEPSTRPGAVRRLLALAIAFVLVVAPAAVRNTVVAHEWIPFTYNLGFNLYAGNNPEATGGFSTITGTQWAGRSPEDGGRGSDGRAYIRSSAGLGLSPAASSAWWAERALRFIAAHPRRAAGLGLTKLGMMWSRREYPQIENADEYAALAGPLGLPVAWAFALAGTLGLAGLLLAWRRGAAERFLAAWVLVLTLAVVPFFVTDRYRHQLLPALVLLAAVALDEVSRAWRARAPAARTRVGLALAAGLVIVMLPAPGLSRAKYEWGLALDLGTRWLEQNRPDRAAKEFERALEMERAGKVRRIPSATASIERASLCYNYATALHLMGRDAEALPLYERAVAEAPDGAPELAGLAEAYRRAGRAADAGRLEAKLAGVAGGFGRVLLARGWQAARLGATAEAESLFARAVEADPGLDDGWTALIRMQVERQEPGRAAATLEAARAAGLAGAELHAHEALVAAARRDRVAAFRALGKIPEQASQGDPTVAEVVRVTRSLIEPSH
jgi:tetratricopeptide (TPR) repeat protein